MLVARNEAALRETATEVEAFVHHVSEFHRAAEAAGLALERFDEWWHADDAGLPPRLATFWFRK